MLKYPYYKPAVDKLERLSKKADELLTGLTAENIEERYRERSTVMIQVENLKKQISDNTITSDEMNYRISPVCRLSL
jgi:hypothetical protein